MSTPFLYPQIRSKLSFGSAVLILNVLQKYLANIKFEKIIIMMSKVILSDDLTVIGNTKSE